MRGYNDVVIGGCPPSHLYQWKY